MTTRVPFFAYAPGHPAAEEARAVFRERMERRYTGWDDAYDRQFDASSFVFAVRCPETGEIDATCRIVFKHIGGIRTPMECGDLGRHLPAEHATVAEGGMVSFRTRGAMLALMHGVCSWLIENDVRRLYVMHATDSFFFRNLYTRTLHLTPVPGAMVSFSGFLSRESGAPARWQVMVGDPVATGPRTLETLRDLGAAASTRADLPRLADYLVAASLAA